MKSISNIVYKRQYSTISFLVDLQESIYKQSHEHLLHVGRLRRPTCSGFGGLKYSIDVFLEAQDKRYSSVLYLIDYIAYGLHLGYEIQIFKGMCRNPI
jgi:hypothetical protein